MKTTANPDNPLLSAQRHFGEAVHALVDRQAQWQNGVCRWADPIYLRLRASLRGNAPRSGTRSVAASRPPCRSDILTLLIDVDMTVAEWQPSGAGTVHRLNTLRGRSWRPEDTGKLTEYRDQLAAWTLKAVEVLGDKTPEVSLRFPCPRCGRRFVHRHNGSENVRAWALRVSEDGARCQGCAATWAPDQFEFLAKLLGCPSLPAA